MTESVLRQMRIAKGLTLEQVGRELGMTAVHVGDMERGRRHITPETARELAGLYGVGVLDLVVEREVCRSYFVARPGVPE